MPTELSFNIKVKVVNVKKLGRKTLVVHSPGFKLFHYKADVIFEKAYYSGETIRITVNSYQRSFKSFKKAIKNNILKGIKFKEWI